MNDLLWTNERIRLELDDLQERRIAYADAQRVLGEMLGDYEADHAAWVAQQDTLNAQIAALTGTVAANQAAMYALRAQNASLQADVTVTVDTSAAKVSNFHTAVSHVSTNDLAYGNPTARARAIAAIAPALEFHRVSAHSYGTNDPWVWDGTGARPTEPTNWVHLDDYMAMIATTKGAPIIGFGNWPWHCKGRWDGKATIPLTFADQLSDDGRPITEKLPDILHFIGRACERYMAAPYNVRYWQLGSWEFHGFERDRKGGFDLWGYDAYPGTRGQADMGMAYLHNQVAAKIIATAASLGMARGDIKIIANYPPLTGRGVNSSESVPVGHPLRDRPWGSANKAPIAALLGMLPLLTPGSFDYWSYDITSRNKDGVARTPDDWINSQRFTDIGEYINSEVARLGFGGVPFIVSEWYNKPQADPGPNQQQLRAALHADALRRFVLLGASMAITWSTVGRANEPGNEAEAGLHSSAATATGGQPQAALTVLQAFRDHFGPGAKVYPLVVSDSRVDGLANVDSDSLLLYNKTANPLKVAVGDTLQTVAGHDYVVCPLGGLAAAVALLQ